MIELLRRSFGKAFTDVWTYGNIPTDSKVYKIESEEKSNKLIKIVNI